jgi:hypothetical protein
MTSPSFQTEWFSLIFSGLRALVRLDDGFLVRRSTAWRTVRSFSVAVLSPLLNQGMRFVQVVEDLAGMPML